MITDQQKLRSKALKSLWEHLQNKDWLHTVGSGGDNILRVFLKENKRPDQTELFSEWEGFKVKFVGWHGETI